MQIFLKHTKTASHLEHRLTSVSQVSKAHLPEEAQCDGERYGGQIALPGANATSEIPHPIDGTDQSGPLEGLVWNDRRASLPAGETLGLQQSGCVELA